MVNITIGDKKIEDLTSDDLHKIIILIGCTPSLEYWNEPIITDFNNTMFSNSIVVDYYSLRKRDELKSSEYTFFFNFEDFSYHYTRDYDSNKPIDGKSSKIDLNVIKYLIKEGYDIPIY